MAQQQIQVDVVFLNGQNGVAVATGNNASWRCCCCAREAWLIGRSGAPSGVTNGTRVECPTCERNYFVVPKGPAAQTRVVRVEEIKWPLRG
jgi:hypothetical protein